MTVLAPLGRLGMQPRAPEPTETSMLTARLVVPQWEQPFRRRQDRQLRG